MHNKTSTLWGYALIVFNLHWFKIGLAVLSLYAFLSRDFSFRISIQAPKEVPTESIQQTTSSTRETLTDNSLPAPHASNHFDFIPSWGEKKKADLVQQLREVDQVQISAFIQRFSHVADAEEEKFGIPANIILAHALLKSGAGTVNYVNTGHNYFALTCTDNWNGGTQDGNRGCIRSYDNAWQSFRDHSLFLTTGKNISLKKLSRHHQAWANALGQIFSGDEGLENQLLIVIERFKL